MVAALVEALLDRRTLPGDEAIEVLKASLEAQPTFE